MNFNLPQDSMWQLASTTGVVIHAYIAPAYIVGGILLAFFIIERLIDAAFPSTPTASPDHGT